MGNAATFPPVSRRGPRARTTRLPPRRRETGEGYGVSVGVGRFLRKQGRQLRRKASLPLAYLRSRARAERERATLAQLERFCLFVGYPRSGHSLVGSLLDAHPDVAISHELHVLRYLRYGFGRDQLLALILENAEQNAAAGRVQTGYGYAVPGMWQGRVRRLRVAGDKRGGTTVRKLVAQPERLETLRERMGVPLLLIHVVRNPFDSIARMALASPHRAPRELSDHYFRMADGVARLRESESVRDVYHEAMIESPREELVALCDFLGAPAPDDYLDACAKIVWTRPQQTRREFAWPAGLREHIASRLGDYPFFARYSFEETESSGNARSEA